MAERALMMPLGLRADPYAAPKVGDSRPPTNVFGSLAARSLAAVGAGGLLLANHVNSLPLILLIVVAVVATDIRHPLSLKNVLLVYVIMVFGVGGAVLHLTTQPIYRDVVAYTVAFLGGYTLASMSTARRHHHPERQPAGKGPLNLFALEHALVVLLGLNLLFVGYQFAKYGVAGYYQGQGLLNQALTYGQASSTGGLEQIVRFALTDGGIALAILYVKACFDSSTHIRYRYPALLFIGLPVLSLSRSTAVNGALIVLAIYACDRRLSARRTSAAGPLPDAVMSAPTAAAARDAPVRVSRMAMILLGLVLAVATAAFVGSIRSGFVNKSGTVGSKPGFVTMLSSELSPVQAYGDITANIDVLGHTHGRTIVFALLLKVVPRAWYPNKPLNSGAYYMSIVRPAEWAAGYALPPTYWGDLYISFGYAGAVLGSIVLGVAAARIDRAYRDAILHRVPWFLLIFANFYAVLRDSLSESLAGILLTLLVWAVANRVFRPDEPVYLSPATA
ncbi:MAG: oligosaccharide repeat unit polymerase [Actinomycetota bacterium]|nr:oligosaccharide repeat unit polymerase [Actinomycetota bacterium]